jgi:hypothetical protein
MDAVEAQGRELLITGADRVVPGPFPRGVYLRIAGGGTASFELLNSGSQHRKKVANPKNGIAGLFCQIKSFIFSIKDSILAAEHGNLTAKPTRSYRCVRVLCLSPGY